MFCPKCGDLMSDDSGAPACSRGRMLLSIRMTSDLNECFIDKVRLPKENPAKRRIGGVWYCPGCGVRMEEQDGLVRCPQCRRCLNQFITALIELHPHSTI